MFGPLKPLLDRLDVASGTALSKAFVAIALGVCLLLIQLDRPEAVLPLLLVVLTNPAHWARFLEECLARFPVLWFVGPLLVIPARLILVDPMPPDDLLRYVAQSAWVGGYQDMYFEVSLPSFEQYPAFDGLMDRLAPVLGLTGTVRLTIGIAWVAFITVFYKVVWKRLQSTSHQIIWACLALLLAISVMSFRLTLGRPEIFLSIWALAAAGIASTLGAGIWAICGVALGMSYWLSPLYFVFVILLPVSWRVRGLYFVAMSLAWIAGWMALTGDVRLEAVRWMFQSLSSRHPGLPIGENQSIISAMGAPLFVILVFVIIQLRHAAGTDWRFLALAGFFALSNQIRYFPLVVCLLIVYAIRPVSLAFSTYLRAPALIWVVLLLACTTVTTGLPARSGLPKFALPDGSRVFTLFGEATYATLFFNAGRVRVTPGFEVGSASQLVQTMNAQLRNEGRLQCDELQRIAATHVVEATLRGVPPNCLKLEAVQGPWRLWLVGSAR